MKKILGNTSDLTPSAIKALERLYQRKVSSDLVISHELAREMAALSLKLKSRLGVIIDRRGRIQGVVRGHEDKISALGQREGQSRFRGVRLIYTKLKHPGLTRKDFTFLLKDRLDLIAQLEVTSEGEPSLIFFCNILRLKRSESR